MIASLIPGAETRIDLLDASVDGWLDPTIRLRSAVGENSTEDDVPIHDHVTPLPTLITVTGIVDSVRSNDAKANEAWAEVEELHRASKILKFTSERGVIDECVITAASTTQKSRGLEFTLDLQQINRVDVGEPGPLAEAVNHPDSAGYRRQPEVKTGSKEPIPVPAEVPTYIDNEGRRRVGNVGDQSPDDRLVLIEDGRVTLKKPDGSDK